MSEPGIERDQIIETAAIERQILHFLLVDHTGHRRRGGVDDGRLRGNRYFLREGADFQHHVHHRILAHFKIDAGAHHRLESLFRRTHLLRPERQWASVIVAVRVREDGPFGAGFDAGNRDGRTVDGAPGRVLNTAGYRGAHLSHGWSESRYGQECQTKSGSDEVR